MQYPLISEYVRAIQDAGNNLDQLSHLEVVTDSHGDPYHSSGAFAVVFKMRDPNSGHCYALKCFTEEQQDRAEAYRMIADELKMTDSPYITSVKYLERELFVDSSCEDDEFPILLMDWIEGTTMEAYIAAHHHDRHAMAMLSYRFGKMAAWLRSQPFAHGDIKPDNIMVRPDGSLVLIDYDGMYVPAMHGQQSPSLGTRDFSHPQRTATDFDETIDDFALASIALSLKALSLDPSLIDRYGGADRLLFSAADYRDPAHSQVLTALQPLTTDPDLCTLLSLFLLAIAKKNLSLCSFRLFVGEKPEAAEPTPKQTPEVLSTEVTDEELAEAVTDEYGVKYSKDGRKLLKAANSLGGIYTIRMGIEVICDRAFCGCKALTNINIPNSVTTIGDSAFSCCNALTSINIPDSVKEFKGNPFAYWKGTLTIHSPYFTYENDILFDKDKTKIIAFRIKFVGVHYNRFYRIPNSVTTIGDSAFRYCEALKSINIPDSVTAIGDYAFSFCSALTNINIPNNVTAIGDYAFWRCKALSEDVKEELRKRFGYKIF